MRKRLTPMPRRFERLAVYNAEKARGIVHNPSWVEFMVKEQAAFNQWQQEQWANDPSVIVMPID